MQAWVDFLKKQEEKLGPDVIKKWLTPLKVVHFDSANLYLEAAESFQLLWFEEHVRSLVKTQFLNANGRAIKVHLTLSGNASSPAPKKAQQPSLQLTSDKLDPNLTFSEWLPSEENAALLRLLHELVGYHPDPQKWSSSVLPPVTFNPLYIWGEGGCGKTHLLSALAHAFKTKGSSVLYAKADTFTEHVVAAIRASEMQTFRKHYRQVDILLIDDVHQLARKYATQEEFFHTFNTLHAAGKQLILSARCTPALLEDIEPRLVSRFEWGLNLHLHPIRQGELQHFLLKRTQNLLFPLSEEVHRFLLSSFSSSTSLNRALDTLILRSHLDENPLFKADSTRIDLATAQRWLADLLKEQQATRPCPENIYKAVSAFYGIREEDLLGKSQAQECSLPRQVAMYLCRQELKLSFQAIGRLFKRDHSTVMTSVKHIEKKQQEADPDILAALRTLRKSP